VYGINPFEWKRKEPGGSTEGASGQGTSREERESSEQEDGPETVSGGKRAHDQEENDEAEPAETIDFGDRVEDARGQKRRRLRHSG
jgi:hypothetical protein